MSNDNPTTKLYCNSCGKETKHEILASVKQGDYETDESTYIISWDYHYQTLQCRGCEHVTYRTRLYHSEMQDDERSPIYEDVYFPPLAIHQKPKWYNELSDEFRLVLDEVYIAFQNNLRYLTAVGTRTAIDMMIVDKIGDVGTFQQKIKALLDRSFINEEEKELIEVVTEAGNAAAHRGYSPDIRQLKSVIDILESLLYKLYIQEKGHKRLLEQARKIKATVPPRNRSS